MFLLIAWHYCSLLALPQLPCHVYQQHLSLVALHLCHGFCNCQLQAVACLAQHDRLQNLNLSCIMPFRYKQLCICLMSTAITVSVTIRAISLQIALLSYSKVNMACDAASPLLLGSLVQWHWLTCLRSLFLWISLCMKSLCFSSGFSGTRWHQYCS